MWQVCNKSNVDTLLVNLNFLLLFTYNNNNILKVKIDQFDS